MKILTSVIPDTADSKKLPYIFEKYGLIPERDIISEIIDEQIKKENAATTKTKRGPSIPTQ